MIRKRVMRTGDGSHKYSTEAAAKKTAKELLDTFNNNNNQSEQQEEEEEHVDTLWGWGKQTFLLFQWQSKILISEYLNRRWRYGCWRDQRC